MASSSWLKPGSAPLMPHSSVSRCWTAADAGGTVRGGAGWASRRAARRSPGRWPRRSPGRWPPRSPGQGPRSPGQWPRRSPGQVPRSPGRWPRRSRMGPGRRPARRQRDGHECDARTQRSPAHGSSSFQRVRPVGAAPPATRAGPVGCVRQGTQRVQGHDRCAAVAIRCRDPPCGAPSPTRLDGPRPFGGGARDGLGGGIENGRGGIHDGVRSTGCRGSLIGWRPGEGSATTSVTSVGSAVAEGSGGAGSGMLPPLRLLARRWRLRLRSARSPSGAVAIRGSGCGRGIGDVRGRSRRVCARGCGARCPATIMRPSPR